MLGDARLSAAAPARRAAGYPVSRLLALPYPVRNLARRWRGLVGMMLGVGISLSLVMTMQAMSKANVDLYTYDFLRSGAEPPVVLFSASTELEARARELGAVDWIAKPFDPEALFEKIERATERGIAHGSPSSPP